jgi:hypothetical protein
MCQCDWLRGRRKSKKLSSELSGVDSRNWSNSPARCSMRAHRSLEGNPHDLSSSSIAALRAIESLPLYLMQSSGESLTAALNADPNMRRGLAISIATRSAEEQSRAIPCPIRSYTGREYADRTPGNVRPLSRAERAPSDGTNGANMGTDDAMPPVGDQLRDGRKPRRHQRSSRHDGEAPAGKQLSYSGLEYFS